MLTCTHSTNKNRVSTTPFSCKIIVEDSPKSVVYIFSEVPTCQYLNILTAVCRTGVFGREYEPHNQQTAP